MNHSQYYLYLQNWLEEISFHGDFNNMSAGVLRMWMSLSVLTYCCVCVCVRKCEIFSRNRQAETGNACLNMDILSLMVANEQKKKHHMQECSLLNSPKQHEDIFSNYCANETNPVFLLTLSQTHSDYKQCSDLRHFCHASTVTDFWGEICGQSF